VEKFTSDELRRIQRTLQKRFRVSSKTNLIDIGFGTALEGGKLQPNRGLCISFFVREKKNPRKKNDRIPRELEVRLKRGRRYLKLKFCTDVVAIGRIVATGKRLDYRTKFVTTGAVVAWKGKSSSTLTWAVVTVGHAFPRLSGLSQLRRKVSIRTSRGKITGTLVAKSAKKSKIDSAIAIVKKEDLISKKIITTTQTTRKIVPRKVAKLMSDRNKAGRTLRVGGIRDFVVHAYLPTLTVIDIGKVIHVVSVLSTRTNTFQKGTSGSNWLIQNQAACVQVAGWDPGFKQGFGQALDAVIKWASKELSDRNLIVSGSFRMIVAF